MSKLSRLWRILWQAAKGLALVAVLVVLMLWLAGTFVRKVEPGPPAAEGPPPPVAATAKVERRVFPLAVEQVGTIQTQVDAQVSSRIMAQVIEVNVAEGDRVVGPLEKGKEATVLARLDDRDIQARIRQAQSEFAAIEKGIEAAKEKVQAAKADVEAARSRVVGARTELETARAGLDAAKASKEAADKDFARYEMLVKEGAATRQQLDQMRAQRDVADAQARAATQRIAGAQANITTAEAQVRAGEQGVTAAGSDIGRLEAQKEQARAAVSEAQVMLTYTVLRAPFNGRVVRKKVEVGTMVVPGQPLFQLESPCCPELHAVVAESLATRLRVGEKMDVYVDALKRPFTGMIREIAPVADPSTRTMIVKVTLPSSVEIVSGLFGRLTIPLGQYEALVVPSTAVRRVGQLALVDVVEQDGRPRRRFVTLGSPHQGQIEVASGLAEGEEVAVSWGNKP